MKKLSYPQKFGVFVAVISAVGVSIVASDAAINAASLSTQANLARTNSFSLFQLTEAARTDVDTSSEDASDRLLFRLPWSASVPGLPAVNAADAEPAQEQHGEIIGGWWPAARTSSSAPRASRPADALSASDRGEPGESEERQASSVRHEAASSSQPAAQDAPEASQASEHRSAAASQAPQTPPAPPAEAPIIPVMPSVPLLPSSRTDAPISMTEEITLPDISF